MLIVFAVALAAAFAGLPGCSGCRGKAPLAFVEHDAMVVVLIPSIADTVRHSKGLMAKLQQGMLSAAMLAKPKADIKRELGFDPEKPETMKAKGIDPGRGISVAVSSADEMSIVLGVADQGALDKYLREQLGKVTRGAAKYKERTVSGVKMTLVMVGGGERAMGAWTFAKKHLVIGISKSSDPSVHVAKLVNLKKSIKDLA